MFAYEQSFLCLAYHCDIWHEAACYLLEQSKSCATEASSLEPPGKALYLKELYENAAGDLYERATRTFMKNNALINLAYADFEEVY